VSLSLSLSLAHPSAFCILRERKIKIQIQADYRFVMQERDEVNQTHQKSDKGLTDELATLNKKVSSALPSFLVLRAYREDKADRQSKYLEKQFEEATSQLRDIVGPDAYFRLGAADVQFHSQQREQQQQS
jgi:hypothetical protein